MTENALFKTTHGLMDLTLQLRAALISNMGQLPVQDHFGTAETLYFSVPTPSSLHPSYSPGVG